MINKNVNDLLSERRPNRVFPGYVIVALFAPFGENCTKICSWFLKIWEGPTKWRKEIVHQYTHPWDAMKAANLEQSCVYNWKIACLKSKLITYDLTKLTLLHWILRQASSERNWRWSCIEQKLQKIAHVWIV